MLLKFNFRKSPLSVSYLGETLEKSREIILATWAKICDPKPWKYIVTDFFSLQNESIFFVFRCLEEDPLCRISAQDALDHPFFKDHVLMPSTKDMVLLPSHILQMFNVFKNEKYDDPKELEGKN